MPASCHKNETVPCEGEGALRRHHRVCVCKLSLPGKFSFRFSLESLFYRANFFHDKSPPILMYTARSWILWDSMDMESSSTKFQFIFLYPLGIDFVSWSFWLPSFDGNLCSVFKIYLGNRSNFFSNLFNNREFYKNCFQTFKKTFLLNKLFKFSRKRKKKKAKDWKSCVPRWMNLNKTQRTKIHISDPSVDSWISAAGI